MRVFLSLLLLLLLQNSRGFTSLPKQQQWQSRGDSLVLNVGSNINEIVPMRKGSSVALITPMTETGSIDLPAVRKLLEWHIESGTDNLCILGTTGEASVMTMEERSDVLKVAVETVKGKIPILVGTGTVNPNSVKAMTMQAMDLGCDASLVVTPYYVKPPQRGLIKHFTDAAALGLPVVVYNVPGRTSVDLLDESMALLSQNDNIVGLKDATGDLQRVQNLRKLVPSSDDLILYSGDDGTSLDFVLQGGDGCISVTANIVPKIMSDIMRLANDGQADQARALNQPLELMHSKLFVEANPIPAKWALKRINRSPTAYCRPPLDEMDPQFHSIVEEALRQAGSI